MAITRAQQFKQMLAQGGRTGFRVGTGEGKDTSGRDYGGSPDRDFGGGGDKVVMGRRFNKSKTSWPTTLNKHNSKTKTKIRHESDSSNA